jgi:hypothetical protein
MINANQIKIGNLAYYKYWNPDPKNPDWAYEVVEVVGIFKYTFYFKYLNSEKIIKSKELYPIPLKEEWLLEHGFIVEQFDYKIPISECGVVWLTLIPQDDMCTAYSVCVSQIDDEEDDSFVFLTDISYVHQIQNFYFSQTNKEL